MFAPMVASSQNPLVGTTTTPSHVPLPTAQPVASFLQYYPGGQFNVAGGMMGPTSGDQMRYGGGYGGGGMQPWGGGGAPVGISNPLLPKKPVDPFGGPIARAWAYRPIGSLLPIRRIPAVWNAGLASQNQAIPSSVDQNTVSPTGPGQYF